MASHAHSGRDTPSRRRLLLGAIDWLLTNGIEDFSLRRVAGNLNTSARMLVYHFGSKDGLRAAILEDVSSRWMEQVSAFDSERLIEQFRAFWSTQLATDEAKALHILAFQFWGAALTSDTPFYDEFRRAVSRGWCEVLSEHFRTRGLDEEAAMARAVYVVATVEGLLLHRITDADLPTDAAFELLIETLDAWNGG